MTATKIVKPLATAEEIKSFEDRLPKLFGDVRKLGEEQGAGGDAQTNFVLKVAQAIDNDEIEHVTPKRPGPGKTAAPNIYKALVQTYQQAAAGASLELSGDTFKTMASKLATIGKATDMVKRSGSNESFSKALEDARTHRHSLRGTPKLRKGFDYFYALALEQVKPADENKPDGARAYTGLVPEDVRNRMVFRPEKDKDTVTVLDVLNEMVGKMDRLLSGDVKEGEPKFDRTSDHYEPMVEAFEAFREVVKAMNTDAEAEASEAAEAEASAKRESVLADAIGSAGSQEDAIAMLNRIARERGLDFQVRAPAKPRKAEATA